MAEHFYTGVKTWCKGKMQPQPNPTLQVSNLQQSPIMLCNTQCTHILLQLPRHSTAQCTLRKQQQRIDSCTNMVIFATGPKDCLYAGKHLKKAGLGLCRALLPTYRLVCGRPIPGTAPAGCLAAQSPQQTAPCLQHSTAQHDTAQHARHSAAHHSSRHAAT